MLPDDDRQAFCCDSRIAAAFDAQEILKRLSFVTGRWLAMNAW